jgi:carboxyl-terminal processing protease
VSTYHHPGLRRLSIFLVLGFVWFCSAFIGGYLLGQADAFAGNHRVSELALRAAAAVGLSPARLPGLAHASLSPEEQARFRVFWEAWGLVSRDFYDPSSVDSQKMTHGAVKGMVDSLGDPHTFFSTPREREMTDASLRGTFDGIGVQVDQRDGKLQVIAPIEGSPAQRAGLRPGDVISHVNGQDLKGQNLNDIVLMIRGPRGTVIDLTIIRAGESEPITLTIERAEIRIETIRSRMLDGNLAYVRVTSFSATSGADAAGAIKNLLQQQPHGFVLDLRSNPGGHLNVAVDLASQFLSDGIVLYQQAGSGERREYRARGGGQATSLPVAVLIDRGSASASEIVAAALRDNGRAVLVGERSYGKGSVQSAHTLSDSSGLRVTSGLWLTPGGVPLEKNGLEPDLAVAPAADGQQGQDPQLEAAVRYLQHSAAALSRADSV